MLFFSRGNYPWGGKFPGGELVKENYTLREFARIPVQNCFYISCFLFSVSILPVDLLSVIVLGKFSLALNCLEDIFVGRVFLRGGGARFPGTI